MHPTGIEPALKASEAFVLSIRLRLQKILRFYYNLWNFTTKGIKCKVWRLLRSLRRYADLFGHSIIKIQGIRQNILRFKL